MLPMSCGSLQVAFGLATPSPTANNGVKVKPGRETRKIQRSREPSCSHGVSSSGCSGRRAQTGTHLSPRAKALAHSPRGVARNQL